MRFERLGLEVEAELCWTASLVVVVSERVADEVRAMAPAARVLVSPNAVDTSAFEVASNVRRSERRRLEVPDNDVLVGFVGRFYVWHGVDILAEAATRFLKERPNARLLLIGDGPCRESALRKLAPWGNRVVAPGMAPHDQIPALMAACDVLVAPHAPIEGFVGSPMKLFEYLASGRAVIASRLEQLAEVLTEGETGLLVTPGDVDELVDAVIRLVDDPELRARLGHAGRQEAFAKHTWQARTRKILDAVEGAGVGVLHPGA
jgi:glycosyltransferase involved in cell wall biosynthesis